MNPVSGSSWTKKSKKKSAISETWLSWFSVKQVKKVKFVILSKPYGKNIGFKDTFSFWNLKTRTVVFFLLFS